ncbi:MAG: hypothetical protein U0931_31370 [Vulcanimicrobiota bacterium]
MKIAATVVPASTPPSQRRAAVQTHPDRFEASSADEHPPLMNRASMQAAVKIPSPQTAGSQTPLGELTRLGGGAMTAGLGVIQAAHGLEDLEKGNLVDGLTDSAGGTLNAWGGTALVAGSSVAAPVAMAVAAGLDGGRDIVRGLQTDDGERVAVGGAKTLGAGMLGAAPFLAGSIIGAPLGAVLGVAGGVLYAGASLFQHRADLGKKLETAANWAGQALGELGTDMPMMVF